MTSFLVVVATKMWWKKTGKVVWRSQKQVVTFFGRGRDQFGPKKLVVTFWSGATKVSAAVGRVTAERECLHSPSIQSSYTQMSWHVICFVCIQQLSKNSKRVPMVEMPSVLCYMHLSQHQPFFFSFSKMTETLGPTLLWRWLELSIVIEWRQMLAMGRMAHDYWPQLDICFKH